MIEYRHSTRWKYFFRSLQKRLNGTHFACPSCGCEVSTVVDRKMLVTSLCRCRDCSLLFRTPTIDEKEMPAFYQNDYAPSFAVPDAELLKDYIATGFVNSTRHYGYIIDVLHALGCKPGQRFLDYGCSWGYCSWQMTKAGFNVQGYEIAHDRCQFAREKLNVDAVERHEQLEGPFDIFFSYHVLEHVPIIRQTLDLAFQMLKPGGLFLSVTPNGCSEERESNPKGWHQWWGLVHPQVPDSLFYEAYFGEQPYLVSGPPFDLAAIRGWTGKDALKLRLSGHELLVAARKMN